VITVVGCFARLDASGMGGPALQVVAGDSLECLLGLSQCSNVAIIPNKDRPSGALSEEERIGFTHANGIVSFSTNLSARPPSPLSDDGALGLGTPFGTPLATQAAREDSCKWRCALCLHAH